MALVTLQRSPSPSNDPDEESAEGGEDGADGRGAVHRKRSKSTLERLRKIFSTVRFISKLRPCLSESYFTVKGAALILPHSELNRKTSRKNHGGEIQRHLQSMLYLLRPEDKIKVAIRLENQNDNEHRYMALVSTMGRQDTEECVILGLDCTTTSTTTSSSHSTTTHHAPSIPPSSPTLAPHGATAAVPLEGRGIALATIGMVLPIWMGMKVRLNGDGGFTISLDDKSYLFKPVSVQAMWSAIQSVDRAVYQAEQTKYLPEGLTHTWVEYYRSKVDHSNQSRLTAWHLMEDVEIFAPANLSFSNENETEKLKLTISAKLKEVMMMVDLDEATSRSLRVQVEEALNMKLDQYRSYFDEELIRILGQMDAPSRILDYLYLGSEWNASNLEELQQLGIKYILNITREIDNFFTGMFHYCNVRLYDQEESELLKHWPKTYKFINKARKHDSKVLVHCKMGISRSASTVMAYLMKENRWTLDKAFDFVKERRNCVRPNKGFMEQLHTYEGILNASNKRDIFRSKSEHDILEAGEGEEDGEESGQQGTFLGDSLFRVMSDSEHAHSLTPEEELLLRKGGDLDYTGMEPDFETDSRSADSMEESLPDMPSPVTEQPPTSIQFLGGGEERGELSRRGPDLLETPGAASRIKPDSSWIKLESPGESTTDPEAMEVKESKDQEANSGHKESEEGQPHQETSDVVFIMGSEMPGEISSQPAPSADSGSGDQAGDIGGGMADQKGTAFDLGIHHYYNREQIPWNPGKVRNLREGFCPDGQNASPTVSDQAKCVDTNSVPCTTPGSGEPNLMESEKSVIGGMSQVPGSQSVVSPCDTCAESPGVGEGQAGEGEEEGMEMDDQTKSVYEREDIQLIPGTVQRTRQEIEERQKLHGEDMDSSVYGMKNVKRSSSLREERESGKGRDSERRKTCPPFVSPPDRECEMEEVGERMVIETTVLELDHQVGESTTDDVEMVEERKKEKAGGEGSQVTVYTFGEESVPVKAGMVRRQKQEIENKSWEASAGHQRSLSFGSSGSVSSVEDGERTGRWSPDHHLQAVIMCSEETTGQTVVSEAGVGHTYNIPTSRQQWTPHIPPTAVQMEGLPPRQSKTGRCGAEGVLSTGAVSEGGAQQQAVHTGAGRGLGKDTCTEGSKGDSRMTGNVFEKHHISADSVAEDYWAETAASKSEGQLPFRPYAHSFPSAKRQPERGHYDSETLAMIREIGSAFVSSPPRREEDEKDLDSSSLVKHLVKNIEKETKAPKQERKIVIIDSKPGQGRRTTKGESGSSLFTPSPEFITNIERQLSQSSQQLPLSQSPPADCPRSSVMASKSVPHTSGDSCAGIAPVPSSPPSCSGFEDKSGSEQPASVVKHLLGRFESRGLHCVSSEGEMSLLAASDSSASAPHLPDAGYCVDDGGGPVVLREKRQFNTSFGFIKSRSVDEPPVGGTSESLPQSGLVRMASFGAATSEPSQPSRRPRSAEHAKFSYAPAAQCASTMPRLQAPWYREVGADSQEQEMTDGVKVRRLHGKSHPLSRLQQQQEPQGEAPYPPTIQRHSPFHSSM